MNRSRHQVRFVRVFAAGPDGGNPAPIVVDAAGMSDAQMQEVASSYGHESGFVLPAPLASDCDFEFRFWVPNHEMSMCGHATVGAVWLLAQLGRVSGDHLKISTKSGRVEARIRRAAGQDVCVEVSQPAGHVEPLSDTDQVRADIVEVLGIRSDDIAPLPIQNARTSRVKTLIPLRSVSVLDGLNPNFDRIERLCSRIASTGLYPYAISDRERQVVDARQFPRSSGYPEDAATGIAASALSFGLLSNGLVEASDRAITVRQGRAMKRPSEIQVRFNLDDGRIDGCWLSGVVQPTECEKIST
ncbi:MULTISPECIES: PhzF family phenazine biosynthesis protein [unclassified Bradyrhizobium]|uniref:PhzF family phenazine biosynthesis protein n=1 Tax=unclassified Bradyrhizobium TaxID=2631580 RepID=UPI0020B388C9|nr:MULTISPECIES: PhzF family phenazine biosynthesis protein [unclassified Bradyrhizobium]MCP3385513.1 PhzF family phenazine biosynthesis protein [Bradyrhizobium sp. CCGUVB4N]MCP3446779.1 PhzF family phenazine biosynthesis protein [Bradyrhizobium sp. CCGUVB14]